MKSVCNSFCFWRTLWGHSQSKVGVQMLVLCLSLFYLTGNYVKCRRATHNVVPKYLRICSLVCGEHENMPPLPPQVISCHPFMSKQSEYKHSLNITLHKPTYFWCNGIKITLRRHTISVSLKSFYRAKDL